MKDKDLQTVTGEITAENWPQELNRMACDSAADALGNLGYRAAFELAFATLQAYFTFVYANSCPLFDKSVSANIRLETLTEILNSCGISFESSIATIEKHV